MSAILETIAGNAGSGWPLQGHAVATQIEYSTAHVAYWSPDIGSNSSCRCSCCCCQAAVSMAQVNQTQGQQIMPLLSLRKTALAQGALSSL